jgi:hypothetical protein
METRRLERARGAEERGSIMILIAVLTSSMALLSLGLLTMVSASNSEQRGSREDLNAIYVAEAGLTAAVQELTSGGDGNVGNEDQPTAYGKGSYWVTATDLGSNRVQLRATGTENRSSSVVELIVAAAPTGFFQWAAFSDEDLTMDANAFIDSYDSSEGSYLVQAVNQDGSDVWANEEGDTGSNLDITLSVNSTVHGDATPGNGHATTITGNASVTGSTEPLDTAVSMPPIVVPGIATPNTDYTVSSDTSLGSGDYRFTNFTVNTGKALTITGPATIVVDNFTLKQNSSITIDAAAGEVEFYVIDDFIIGSNTTFGSSTQQPLDLSVNLLSDNIIDPNVLVILQEDSLMFNSNAKMYGTIYAPSALVAIDSNFELFGAVMARQVSLDSNARIHYDEVLLNAEGVAATEYSSLCWRIVGNQ